jgi:hypothetical protein
MKELRFDAADGVWRVAFAFDPKRQAILHVDGDKSGGSQKRFYRELIRKADDRFDAHLNRQKKKGAVQYDPQYRRRYQGPARHRSYGRQASSRRRISRPRSCHAGRNRRDRYSIFARNRWAWDKKIAPKLKLRSMPSSSARSEIANLKERCSFWRGSVSGNSQLIAPKRF